MRACPSRRHPRGVDHPVVAGVRIEHGDCRDVVATLAEASVDSCVTDPPYSLVSIVKRYGGPNAAPTKDRDGLYKRASAGFMGKQWDTGETAFDPAFWADVLRVLKPGAHLLAFSGTRTYHRLACAIEDAGFEIRDQIGWLYGSGFPKSHNQGDGWGTALKPAWEPIVLARKPLSGTVAETVQQHGTGALNIDGCRVGFTNDADRASAFPGGKVTSHGKGSLAGPGAAQVAERSEFVAERNQIGRWPANVIHDGSDEVLQAFAAYGEKKAGVAGKRTGQNGVGNWGYGPAMEQWGGYAGSGTACRFFYSAKADSADRLGSKHPTVKPVDLMAYLCRLVTPPGGLVLDPFAGSGTTGMACLREGFQALLIEREAEYVADIQKRLAHVRGADTPLFSDPYVAPTGYPQDWGLE